MPEIIRKFKDLTDLSGSYASLKQILLQKLNYHIEDVSRLEKALGDQRGIQNAYNDAIDADPKIMNAGKKIDVLQKQIDKLEPLRKEVEKLSDQYETKEKALNKIEEEYKKSKKDKKMLQADSTYKSLKKDAEKSKKNWLSAEKKIKDWHKINRQLQTLKYMREKLRSDLSKSLGLTLISDGTRFLLYIGKKLHVAVPIKN